jgi:hypothetical protein
MATRTKAERSAAAKKGAATRKENEAKQGQGEAKDAGEAITEAALSIAKTTKKALAAAAKRVEAEKSKRSE